MYNGEGLDHIGLDQYNYSAACLVLGCATLVWLSLFHIEDLLKKSAFFLLYCVWWYPVSASPHAHKIHIPILWDLILLHLKVESQLKHAGFF